MQFEKFGSLTRFSQGWTITEKLDGTNGQIAFAPIELYEGPTDENSCVILGELVMRAGSRNRWLTLDKDNAGFCWWAFNNAEELSKMGVGRHYGEWYGSGIQRGYGLSGGDKRFALFNALRWTDNPDTPECCEVVHAFMLNEYVDNPHGAAMGAMSLLKQEGSQHVRGFDNPEGIVMFHRKSGVAFKKTFDYDEKGKWAEQEANRQG